MNYWIVFNIVIPKSRGILLLLLTLVSCHHNNRSVGKKLVAQDHKYKFETSKNAPYDLSIIDARNDSTLFTIPNLDCQETNFYKDARRYFFTCENVNKKITIWEVEMELQRIMKVDLSKNDVEKLQNL